MTKEEKAKAYDEALHKAKRIINVCADDNTECRSMIACIQQIFPELKESEDERIRKRIIHALHGDVLDMEETTKAISWLEKQGEPEDMGEVSDGYHTFNELYYYRMLYNAAFFNRLPKDWVHKSKRHHDGEECFGGGWFIVMANLPTGQISNHYELKDWDLFQIPEKDIADEWDGHTPQEAAERLHKFLLEKQGEQKSIDKEYTFKSIPRLLDMIEPTDRAKSYCKKLIDSLQTEGYSIDAKIVGEVLKGWNGEDVPMAVMDEQKVPVLDFKVGDWVVLYPSEIEVNRKVVQISRIERCQLNMYWTTEGTWFGDGTDARLWTIKDAKDGDVLHSTGWHNDCIFIFNGLDNWKFDEPNGDRAVATGYCCLSVSADNMEFGIQGPDCVEVNTIKPATKIQRDLLYQKMHEAGYMWNEEKKELEKIESTRPMLSDFFNAEYERGKADALQSIEWSEEDEKTLNEIFSVAARASLRKSTLFGKSYDYIKWQNWLKSLRDRVQLQPKQEWSEQRHVWKPSEDQMRALHDMNLTGNISYVGQGQTLIELYNDLKKL